MKTIFATLLALSMASALGGEVPFIDAYPDAYPDAIDAPKAALPLGGETEAAPSVYPLAPRADEPAAVTEPPRILRWERQCINGVCQVVPVYSEDSLHSDEVVTQAARKLEHWRDLPPEEAKRLADIVDEPERKKARVGHYSPGTCGMLGCRTHPGHWVPGDADQKESSVKPAIMVWQPVGLRGRRGYWVTVEKPDSKD